MTHPVPQGYEFWDRQLRLLGERDPIAVLADTARELGAILESMSPEERRRKRPDGGWSAQEVLGHLVDVDWVFGYRARVILCEASAGFDAIDQERWVRTQDWNSVPAHRILGQFEQVRSGTLAFWRYLPDDRLGLSGTHRGAGVPMTLEALRRIQAGHDLGHIEQVRALAG